MLGNPPFNFHTIEKITTAFGYMFENITLQRFDPETSAIKSIKVPISQAAKEKWVVRDLEDPNAGDESRQRHVQIVLPRMGYDLVDMRYDSHRKLNTVNYRVAPSGNGPSARVQLNPVPYIYVFSLYLQTRTLGDAYAIVEQVLSFFRPDYVVPIIDIPEMNLKRDIIFTLTSHSHTDSYDGSFLDKRVIEWQFNFEAQGHIYPPIKEKPVVTQATITDGIGDTIVTVVASPNTANIDEPYDIIITEA